MKPAGQTKSGISSQDKALEEHLFSFLKGCGDEYTEKDLADLRAVIARARRHHDLSFGVYVATLIEADAAHNGWVK